MSEDLLTTRTLHDAFIDAEEALGLFDVTARGRRYWPWVRHAVFSRALVAAELMGRPQGHWRDRPLGDFLEPFRHPLGPTLKKLRWGDIDPAELLVFNHNRQSRTDAGFVCPYSFPLLEGTGRARQVMQASHNGVLAMPPAEKATRYLEGPTLLHGARQLLLHGGQRLRRAEKSVVSDWVDALGRRLGAPLPTDTILAEVQAVVLEDAVRRSFYPRLLDRVRPRAVILVVHYSRRCMAMTELARERGIPVIELQHGLIGPTHLAYNYAPGRCPEMFPDYLFTFGDFWREITPGLPLPAERAPAVGFEWLDRHRREAIAEASGTTGDPRTLLFLSQGSIGKELSRLAVETSERLDPRRWRVRYRLHPGEKHGWERRYPWLEGAALEVDEGARGVYDAFAAADAQVGVYSTAVYEGLTFGLRTLVARLPGWEGAEPLVTAGVASAVGTAAELVDALEAEPVEGGPDAAHRVWADRPRARFEDALEAVLRSGSTRDG